MIHVRMTEVTVCAVPENHIDHVSYAITVQWRGGETYAVCRQRLCLGANGKWSWESIPSERTDEWLATHRFTYDEAYQLAVREAPNVMVNGRKASEVAERIASPYDSLAAE